MDIKQSIKKAIDLYRDNQYGESERLLLELVKEAPGYANLHNMLGVIYSNNNQFRRAIHHFREALKINPQYTEAQLNLAITLADTGFYDQAEREFGSVTEREKASCFDLSSGVRIKLANRHIEQGKAYEELGLNQEATEEYRKAIKLCPYFADIHNRLGNTYRKMGRFVEGEEAIREALRINPNYSDGYTNLGLLFYYKSMMDFAVQNWEEALRINPKNRVAQVYLRMTREKGSPGAQSKGA